MYRVAVGALFLVGLQAQVLGVRSVVATGNASVFAAPDQLAINASVNTTGASAQDAASKNADLVTSLLAALQQLIGTGGDAKTGGYFITPEYRYPSGGGTPTITGYTASSTIIVTLRVLVLAGPVIDAFAKSGASSVGGLSFSLNDPEPQRVQALRLATQQARAHAEAMANGAGRMVGAVVSLQEGSYVRVQPIFSNTPSGAAGASATTPVQPGLIEVQASVTLTADLN